MDAQTYDYFLLHGNDFVKLHQHDAIAIYDKGVNPSVTDVMNAGDDTRAMVVDLDGLLNVSEPETEVPTLAALARVNGVDLDALIKKHADRLQNVYDQKTAGDYTFIGSLFMMLQELEGR